MDTPLDGTCVAQHLDSKLILAPEILAGHHIQQNAEHRIQATCPPWALDEGWMSDPSDGPRSRPRPREARYRRQATTTFNPNNTTFTPPRASRTWGPGGKRSMRPHLQLTRRKSPAARLEPHSRSTSPRRTFTAKHYYEDFLHGALQGALQSGAVSPFDGAATSPGCHEIVFPLDIQNLWSEERYDPFSSRQLPHGPLSLETPEAPLCQITTVGPAQESTDESFSKKIDQRAAEAPPLGPDHRFWKIKDSLVHQAQALFARSHRLVREVNPKKKHSRPVFACPFFRRDPSRHWLCLADTSTDTIANVKHHLWRHHSQPYYCPVCYDIFPLASERDAHILRRECDTRDVVRFSGMTPEQKMSIAARREDCSGEEQWCGIWRVLFGQPRGALEPFLPAALSWNVLLVVGFWESQGREITEKFLEDAGMMGAEKTGNVTAIGGANDEEDVLGLVNVVLQDLVRLTFWRSGLVHGLGDIPVQECSA